ncbi:MAG: methyltransferase [Ilumatobacteraceae bacterium]
MTTLTGARRRAHSLLMRMYGPWATRRVRRQQAWRWRGLTLTVPTGVFHPGLFFSSGVLAAEIERRKPRDRSVLDVGCGSGVLALAAARAGAVVTAVDINARAVLATTSNAEANGLHIEVLPSDLFAALNGRRFDLIVVNPPYFAKDPVDDAERAWFAGADLGYFERFFAGLGDHLALGPSGGTALMVLGEGCDMVTISTAAQRYGFALGVAARQRVWLGVQVIWTIQPQAQA